MSKETRKSNASVRKSLVDTASAAAAAAGGTSRFKAALAAESATFQLKAAAAQESGDRSRSQELLTRSKALGRVADLPEPQLRAAAAAIGLYVSGTEVASKELDKLRMLLMGSGPVAAVLRRVAAARAAGVEVMSNGVLNPEDKDNYRSSLRLLRKWGVLAAVGKDGRTMHPADRAEICGWKIFTPETLQKLMERIGE